MIDLTKDDGVWVVTINRPDKANSLTKAMLEELAQIAQDAAGDARVLILSGSGKVFSAGADLDEAKAGLATDDVWERLSAAIAAAPCLTIAALNGTLAGGAFGMALACDLRISVASAKFFYPVMKLGYLPQPSDPARLTALVGPARAKMILMAGQKIRTDEALSWGLIDRVVEVDNLMDAALELADHARLQSADHVAAMKRMIR
ncbi:Enoyl-CoA hydratase/carnithine racemase [Aliiroseovarius halocynthiae]|uniref:Enoyl-CoA hydratase/isomerase family protein n=1 Tax=Aliiroseovarius halocynthiae TaxID=985055 RepID=A0A545SLJ7_9RHOB|nr:enoyl-CoA hydratase/isomerase family protein [Aliiroseovarius halocynthiae]TQV65854.1 enoyl-CoA hydratase/isomerase family protein [Aliiroseovarius halocynthiae]SMR83519.1 Enoyl-CoA hydratase/carnithine racemase [Aliiroseovarius halocynthiae]